MTRPSHSAMRVCGPMANAVFHHRPDPAAKIEADYHKVHTGVPA